MTLLAQGTQVKAEENILADQLHLRDVVRSHPVMYQSGIRAEQLLPQHDY